MHVHVPRRMRQQAARQLHNRSHMPAHALCPTSRACTGGNTLGDCGTMHGQLRGYECVEPVQSMRRRRLWNSQFVHGREVPTQPCVEAQHICFRRTRESQRFLTPHGTVLPRTQARKVHTRDSSARKEPAIARGGAQRPVSRQEYTSLLHHPRCGRQTCNACLRHTMRKGTLLPLRRRSIVSQLPPEAQESV